MYTPTYPNELNIVVIVMMMNSFALSNQVKGTIISIVGVLTLTPVSNSILYLIDIASALFILQLA